MWFNGLDSAVGLLQLLSKLSLHLGFDIVRNHFCRDSNILWHGGQGVVRFAFFLHRVSSDPLEINAVDLGKRVLLG